MPTATSAAIQTPRSPLTIVTREDWDEFVALEPSRKPDMPTPAQLRQLSETGRRRLDKERRVHHTSFGPLDTHHVRKIRELAMEQIALNANTLASAKYGLVVDGDAMHGKTTALLDLGKRYERRMRRQFPGRQTATGDDHIPVVYVSVAGDTTVKGLNRALLRFCGHPYRDGSKDNMTEVIQDVARSCAITLVLIDDIHHIDVRFKEHARLAAHLKHLTSTIGATFIYAGIDCEATSILAGESGASRSTAGRCETYWLSAHSRKRATDRKRWLSDIAGIEQELALFDATPGMLLSLEEYLYHRSGGVFGTLTELIRKAANRAIATGEERITEALLDSVSLNHRSPRPHGRQ